MVTFTNDFHGTAYVSSKRVGETLSAGTIRRIERELCGIESCLCGRDVVSSRGSRYYVSCRIVCDAEMDSKYQGKE